MDINALFTLSLPVQKRLCILSTQFLTTIGFLLESLILIHSFVSMTSVGQYCINFKFASI